MDRAGLKDKKREMQKEKAPLRRLPDAELEIMKELWAAGEPLIRAALEQRLTRRQWSSTTLLALLARLEEKGYVAREKQGRGYLYTAVLTREEYLPVESRSALGRMFGGSAKNLVAAMAETNTLTDAEIDELADFLEQLHREGR